MWRSRESTYRTLSVKRCNDVLSQWWNASATPAMVKRRYCVYTWLRSTTRDLTEDRERLVPPYHQEIVVDPPEPTMCASRGYINTQSGCVHRRNIDHNIHKYCVLQSTPSRVSSTRSPAECFSGLIAHRMPAMLTRPALITNEAI